MKSQANTTQELSHSKKLELVPEILKRLDDIYSVSDWSPSGKPVDELVSTILSQNTSDSNTHRAFTSLRSTFSSWTDVIDAPTVEIAEAIRAGGLADQKAPRIQTALEQLVDRDSIDPNADLLEQLLNQTSSDALNRLKSLQGVGPKTAACVLLFAVGQPVVPVDTHVYRVSQRIGLIGQKTNANQAHDELLEIVPDDEAYRFHMHFIHHGRATCKARNPKCGACVLNDICLYSQRSKGIDDARNTSSSIRKGDG
jgi:endonuclease III